jgi:glycosyltransferase involved in cell wall biosynthesis
VPLKASVIISSYNYAPFLAGAIQSALDQEPPVEVIVVDDGSADASVEVAASFGERITLVAQENSGQAAALNAGLERATGDFVAFCDSDDLLGPTRVARVREVFTRNLDLGWVLHSLQWVNRTSLAPVARTDQGIPTRPSGRWDARPIAQRGRRLPLPAGATSCISLRTDYARRIAPIPVELSVHVDEFLRQAAISRAPGYYIDEPLGMMGVHEDNVYNGQVINAERALVRSFASLHTALAILRDEPQLAAFCDRLAAPALIASALGRVPDQPGRAAVERYRAARPRARLLMACAIEAGVYVTNRF